MNFWTGRQGRQEIPSFYNLFVLEGNYVHSIVFGLICKTLFIICNRNIRLHLCPTRRD